MKGLKKEDISVAIVGATGAVGIEILRVLERRNFPVGKLKLLASSRSLGKTLDFQGKEYAVEELKEDSFEGVDAAFFSAGATRSKEFVPHAVRAGAVVVDNSSAFRMMDEVPLVVPEVNRKDMLMNKGIIANPNCTAAILCVALWPLHKEARAKRVIVSTYQSASGAGAKAMQELENQVKEYVEGQPLTVKAFPHQIAFNVFSHNAPVEPNGFNGEENKVVEETRKMFHEPKLQILPTCIRVPVLRAHAESVVVEFEDEITAEKAREILEKSPGIRVVDNVKKSHFPMPIEASGELDVLVGRIRQDINNPKTLAFFVSGDQLLKGAAWNAVQIAEELTKIDS